MNNEDKDKDNKNRNRKLWVDALRSGLYKQGYGQLHKNDEFCCLGVACEIYQKEVGDLVVDESDFLCAYDGNTYFLPPKVQDWLGLHHFYGRFNTYSSLGALNDRGYSFEKIADLIESLPAGLFINEEERS